VGVAVATLVTICTAPVLVGLFGSMLLHERLTRAMVAALACALVGTALLVGIHPGDAGTQGSAAVRGVLLALGAAVCFAVFVLGSRLLAHRYHPLQSITLAVAIGGGLLLAVSAVTTGITLAYPAPVWAFFLYPGRADRIGLRLFYHGVSMRRLRRRACQPGRAADSHDAGDGPLRRAVGTDGGSALCC
jgi:DME family drug/metabolite transporter